MAEINFDPSLAETFLVPFDTKRQMRDWIYNFLGLDFPDSYVDPDSNASPMDWMFETYRLWRYNLGNTSPEILVISSRESYKTLSEAVFSTIAMSHFGANIAHMAAIVPQATAAQKYMDAFLTKLDPYMKHYGMTLVSQNSKETEVKMSDGTVASMKIIVCTLTGANSAHTGILTVDEIDTIRSAEAIRAYKEAQYIPGVFNGQHPISIKTSTLKFPGGLFMKEWQKAIKEKYKIFKWNIIDITEYCRPERHRPDLPYETVYVYKGLPLSTLNKQDFQALTEKEKDGYDEVQAMGGCAKCTLLPVCRGRLAKRSPDDTGGLWKPLDFTISQFKKVDPDTAESQLMCWKPSSKGMVYPRFLNKADGTGNAYTLQQAWEVFTGTSAPPDLTLRMLTDLMLSKGIKFYAGVDWGFRHAFAITVSAILPNGEWWLVDTYSVPGLEFAQMMDLARTVRDTYRPSRWFADTAQPMFILAFRRERMPCAKFTKDVRGGIESVRGQIIDATGRRRMKVLVHSRNEMMFRVMAEHTFKLDSNGNLTDDPDDSDVADVADALRYKGQNLFGKRKIKDQGAETIPSPFPQPTPLPIPGYIPPTQYTGGDWMSQKIQELAGHTAQSQGSAGNNGIIWDFSGDIDE